LPEKKRKKQMGRLREKQEKEKILRSEDKALRIAIRMQLQGHREPMTLTKETRLTGTEGKT